jgi:hypothetical protein
MERNLAYDEAPLPLPVPYQRRAVPAPHRTWIPRRDRSCLGYLSVITVHALKEDRDPTLDMLLELDGTVFVVDSETGYWVKFVVLRPPVSPERPHGIGYSLTLHGPNGERLVGFDNAHPAAGQKRGQPQDHSHRLRTIKAYEYQDAAALLADFWKTVDAVLREMGVIRCPP